MVAIGKKFSKFENSLVRIRFFSGKNFWFDLQPIFNSKMLIKKGMSFIITLCCSTVGYNVPALQAVWD